jgi:Ser/Thr protein kinase RdoA (MazF antagonist)
LKFELSYLDYLKQSDFPYTVPSAIPTKNGRLFATVQGHYYWLYRFLEGGVVESLDQSHLAQLALMMARLHGLIVRSSLLNGKPSSDPYNRAATLKEIEEYRAEILRKKNTDEQERTFLDESVRLTGYCVASMPVPTHASDGIRFIGTSFQRT